MFKIKSLGHVVLNVSDLSKSEEFYSDLLGLPVCARFDEQGMKMTFFTLGDHHDLAIAEVSGEGSATSENAEIETNLFNSSSTSSVRGVH